MAEAPEGGTGVDAPEAQLPPGYPAGIARHVRTKSGEVVHLRPITPEDAPGLVAFHSALSASSVYLRFFSFHPVLSAREVERFTHVDYVERLALVVETGGRLVAVARYDRLRGSDSAEVAFVVDDDYQNQGLGTLLADELAGAAWAHGIRRFEADTLAENSAMLDLFNGIGFPVTTAFEGGVVRVRFPIEPTPAYLDALARREAARRVPDPPPATRVGC